MRHHRTGGLLFEPLTDFLPGVVSENGKSSTVRACYPNRYTAQARDVLPMLETPWPESAEHPDLIRDAVHTFDILRNVLRRLHGESGATQDRVDLDALYIWSTVHGLAGVMNGSCIDQLDLKPKVLTQAIEHVIEMVALGLAAKG